jgi:hypothetical protein
MVTQQGEGGELLWAARIPMGHGASALGLSLHPLARLPMVEKIFVGIPVDFQEICASYLGLVVHHLNC